MIRDENCSPSTGSTNLTNGGISEREREGERERERERERRTTMEERQNDNCGAECTSRRGEREVREKKMMEREKNNKKKESFGKELAYFELV